MNEISEKLTSLSVTDIILSFRDALVCLYPILIKLDCLSDDTQFYDDFDEVAEKLWNVLVVSSLKWKFGLDLNPTLPTYGFSGFPDSPNKIIISNPNPISGCRFIQFVGNREFGNELFNAVDIESLDGKVNQVKLTSDIQFDWVH
jgi:hypothetical protein